MITIIDYGMGNLASVRNAIKKLGYDCIVSGNKDDIVLSEKLVLPGVGAFSDGIKNLAKLDLIKVLNEQILDRKKKLIGICLGMQLMCKESLEHGRTDGFGWFDSSVRKFPSTAGIRIPHMGWNNIKVMPGNRLAEPKETEDDYYFVHSYYVDDKELKYTTATCRYGIEFSCMIEKENIFGVQFHPEKSQGCGLSILRKFCELD